MTDITDEWIRKMAYASGLDCEVIGGLDGMVLERLRRFAELARQDERRCAARFVEERVAEMRWKADRENWGVDEWTRAYGDLITEIRLRGSDKSSTTHTYTTGSKEPA